MSTEESHEQGIKRAREESAAEAEREAMMSAAHDLESLANESMNIPAPALAAPAAPLVYHSQRFPLHLIYTILFFVRFGDDGR